MELGARRKQGPPLLWPHVNLSPFPGDARTSHHEPGVLKQQSHSPGGQKPQIKVMPGVGSSPRPLPFLAAAADHPQQPLACGSTTLVSALSSHDGLFCLLSCPY